MFLSFGTTPHSGDTINTLLKRIAASTPGGGGGGAGIRTVFVGRAPLAPDDPSDAALNYDAGGGTLTQWDPNTSTWV